MQWLVKNYQGPWDRTEPIQAFIQTCPDDTVRTGLRGRVIQSIVNRYLHPLPKGPAIRIPHNNRTGGENADSGKKSGTSDRRGRHRSEDADAWLAYVPVFLRPAIQQHSMWSAWISRFIVTLGANVVRKMLVRQYVTHVFTVFFRSLGCETSDDLMQLDRLALARAVGEANRGRVPQQRLARVELNRFFASKHRSMHIDTQDGLGLVFFRWERCLAVDVAFADQNIFAQRLRLRNRHIVGFGATTAPGMSGGGAVAVITPPIMPSWPPRGGRVPRAGTISPRRKSTRF
jgi:hypothetical protein